MADLIQNIEKEIEKKLFNKKFNLHGLKEEESSLFNQQIVFDQYKLLVDSAHKNEERRGGSNNIFLGFNTLLASFLIRPTQLDNLHLRDVTLVIFLSLIGSLVSWEWLQVTRSYQALNTLNFSLIKAFEDLLPTYVFSLRGKLEAYKQGSTPRQRANIILNKETYLPKAFLLFYTIYCFMTIFYALH